MLKLIPTGMIVQLPIILPMVNMPVKSRILISRSPLKVPFKFTNAELDLYAAAYVQYLSNYDNSVYYGASLLGYWLLVMCASSLFYWSKFLFHN